jgi:tetratricopeptide (TPR) repeat protein
METKTPEELAASGQAAYRSGDYQAASQAYEAAARGYAVRGDQVVAAEMANNQCVALLQLEDAQAALIAVRDTPSVFETAGDSRRQAMAYGNLGAALEALDRLEEAETAYQRSADLFAQLGEGDLRADVLQSLSKLQLRTGRQLQALATMQAGVDGIERPSVRQRLLKKLLNTPFNLFKRS